MTAFGKTLTHRRREWAVIIIGLVLMGFVAIVVVKHMLNMLGGKSESYARIDEHFKYGSVGSDTLRQGFPYWIWKVLPIMFKDRLPDNGKPGYEAFGLIVERDPNGTPMQDRPVGFSKRRIGLDTPGWGLDMVGLNCAFCHASTIRRDRQTKPDIVLGMPAHTVDVEDFFVFLFDTAKDARFTGQEVMNEIVKQRRIEQPQSTPMGFVQRAAYQWILIPLYRWEIGKLELKFCFIHKLHARQCATTVRTTNAGPGRLDLWAPYKVLRFATWNRLDDLLPDLTPSTIDFIDQDVGKAEGFADMAPLWQLEKRIGSGFHWDGNTLLLHDYTIIAALGLNIMPRSLDVAGFNRIALWARTRPSPREYDKMAPEPFRVNGRLREAGQQVYFQHCAACHTPGERKFGLLEPIASVGTDRARLDAFTDELATKLKELGKDYDWKLRHFEKTSGYTNLPLDGIWLRAPYLHNGSVPTLRQLLYPPCDRDNKPNHCRPTTFYRGNDLYDWTNVGFISNVPQEGQQEFFPFDTSRAANGNQGHTYGIDLSDREKDALLEFLKTL